MKASLYRRAVQVYEIPNQYPMTFSPSILKSSSKSQKYKNCLKIDLTSYNAHVGFFSGRNLSRIKILPQSDMFPAHIQFWISRIIDGHYHIAIKADLYHKAVQVYDIYVPNQYLVTQKFCCLLFFSALTLKVPITTAADNIHKYFFIIFQRK